MNRGLVGEALRLLVLAVLLAGCQSNSSDIDEVVVRDSSGVRIVESPAVESLPTTIVSDSPRFRVGWEDGDPPFENVRGGVLLPGGAAVVDGQGARLYLIDSAGSVQSIGRRGEGPGEFRSPGTVLATPEGGLAVWDDGLTRLSKFSGGGEFLESHFVPPGGGGVLLKPQGVIAGSELGWIPTSVSLRQGEGSSAWYDGPLVRRDLGTLAEDTVREVRFVLVEMDGDRPNSNPFLRFGAGDVHDGGFVWATNDRPEVQWIGPDGSVEQIARWSQRPVPVDDEFWNRFERITREENELRSNPVSAEALAEQLRDQRTDAAADVPFFRFVHATPEGDVWLSEYTVSARSPTRFLVISSDGFPQRWVTFSDPIRVLDIGRDRVLGLQEDGWGVQAVVVHSLSG